MELTLTLSLEFVLLIAQSGLTTTKLPLGHASLSAPSLQPKPTNSTPSILASTLTTQAIRAVLQLIGQIPPTTLALSCALTPTSLTKSSNYAYYSVLLENSLIRLIGYANQTVQMLLKNTGWIEHQELVYNFVPIRCMPITVRMTAFLDAPALLR